MWKVTRPMIQLAIIATTCHAPAALFRVFGNTHGRKADAKSIPVANPTHFFSTLSELQGKPVEAQSAMLLADAELGHYSVSMGVATLSSWAPSMALTCVYVHFLFGPDNGMGQIPGIATGTLREWRDEIRSGLLESETSPIRRAFASESYKLLKATGFGDIFGVHSTSTRRDGTLKLVAN